jgi:hypothetical protein
VSWPFFDLKSKAQDGDLGVLAPLGVAPAADFDDGLLGGAGLGLMPGEGSLRMI